MFLCISNVLNEGQLAELASLFDAQSFIDGRATAGAAGTNIKANLQIAGDATDYTTMRKIVTDAVNANRQLSLIAIPRFIQPIRFARYTQDMYYGRHMDNAVMGSPPSRIDLAFTIFLSDPEEYEGGELVVYDQGTQHQFKLPKGSAVLYEANSLHEVTKVTSGRRDVAVGWLQSMVRDAAQRRVLFELEELRASMLAKSGRTQEFDIVSRNVAELWHMWVEV